MTNAERILTLLDTQLTSRVELTLYGRAALHLGFSDAPKEHALSRDVDAVLWLGQAEALNEETNFWEAIEHVNQELADQELYISHFFTESQVILLPDWRSSRIPISGKWTHLDLYRLGNIDLLLSKLMRDDPIDHADAQFIARASNLGVSDITAAIAKAHVPDAPEIQEQFELASRKLLKALTGS
ncbi:MAG: hypothetical protein HN919_03360 [Verrucomicrobia bacterium]|jgi:hypothetical protein|nr:hypothetical protein [Verrucomicrobiota bacterium]MBT7698909.1 hypothetical protein [Verrucomicrobiota bacterium]